MNTSIIVCTYNEEETIFGVVAACCKHNPGAEIIVVDDASTDSTEEVLSSLALHYKFEYLKLDRNRGKSYAMAYGVEYATNEVILFFNANVKDIREHHFSNLLNPILQGKADLVLGLPSAYTVDFRINPYKSVVGQKAMLKEDLLPILDDIRELRFGVESYITLYYQTIGKRMHFVSLDGLQTQLHKLNDEQMDDAEGSLEVANALLTNIDLITKRVQNNIQKTQNYTRSTISSVQLELNRRMLLLKQRNGEIELV
jgi:hypothetical protein